MPPCPPASLSSATATTPSPTMTTPGTPSIPGTVQALQENLKPLLPSKYHFELRNPVVFVCTRIGEVGSALFTSTTATDDKDVTLTATESQGLVDFVCNPDPTKLITASGRKFVICSHQGNWFHGRCISSRRHQGGIILSSFKGGLILVCVYENPMTVFDAMKVASKIEANLGDYPLPTS
jgi:hypothetical protein